MRFLHIADVHLDRPFAGRSEALRNRLRHATRQAFERCVTTSLSERVHALLIAGDLFDTAYVSFETERFLTAQVARLASAGIQVVYVTGNHDPGDGARANELAWPDSVTVISGQSPVSVPIADQAGDTVGYVTGAGHATARETDDLAQMLRPVPDVGVPQVALLHSQVWAADASASQSHRDYAPSSLSNLRGAGFQYWALGHVHQRREVSSDPAIHYPGCIQGHDPSETGAKGGLLVDLGGPAPAASSAPAVVEFHDFAPIRWEKLTVAGLDHARTLDDVVTAVTKAWEAARAEDEAGQVGPSGADAEPADVEWVAAVELAGPSPIWRQLRDPQELDTIGDEVAQRLQIVAAQVRAGGVHAKVRADDHLERRDVLGATLQLAAAVAGGGETLGVGEADLAGFEPDRDGTVEAYLQRLLAGGGEEVVVRMLDPEETAT